jgi:hypothetical protein
LTEIKTNSRAFKLNPEKITGTIALLILSVILFRFTFVTYGMPNVIFTAINISLLLICFIFILITDESVKSLIGLPLLCAVIVFISAAVHRFEFHRGAIFNTFISQLFYMYLFVNLSKKYSKWAMNGMMGYTLFMAAGGLIFTLLGIHYILGLRVSTPAEYGFRSPSVFFSNGAYMGFFATFMLVVIFFSRKINLRNGIMALLLFGMLILSSNRTALFGFLLMILLYIIYSPKITVPYKFFSLFSFLILMSAFMLIWFYSPYNFKSPDSGRLLLLAKSMKLVKEGFFFGAGSLMIDSRIYITQIHNMYLAMIAEFGIFTLIAYMVYLGWFFRKSGKRGRIIMVYLFIYAIFHPGFYIGFSENFYLFLMLIIYMNHYEKEQDEGAVLQANS